MQEEREKDGQMIIPFEKVIQLSILFKEKQR